jgi:hypothetical protein
MVVLDRLLGGEQAELALGADVVERDVQSAVGPHPTGIPLTVKFPQRYQNSHGVCDFILRVTSSQ